MPLIFLPRPRSLHRWRVG